MKQFHQIICCIDFETLGDFFASVLTNDPAEDITVEQRCDNVINQCHISSSSILKKLEKVNSTKSAGPNELHPRVLKETNDSIASALALIFKDSLERGSLPLNWKKAHISALHKKGAKDLPGNYRPVSLTSVVCKVLESILRDKIMDKAYSTYKRRVMNIIRVLRWTQDCGQIVQYLQEKGDEHNKSSPLDTRLWTKRTVRVC